MKINENEKTDMYLDLARELKKVMEYKYDSETNCNWCTRNDLQRLAKGTGRDENWGTSRSHPNFSIIKMNQNSEKSPGDLKRLVVTQTQGKDHQLTRDNNNKISSDFKMQTDRLTLDRIPDLVMFNKKKENLLYSGLWCPNVPQRLKLKESKI